MFVDEGIVLVGASQAFAAAAISVTGLVIVSRLLEVRVGAMWRELWPLLAAATGTAAVLIGVERVVSAPWPAVTLGLVAGGSTYFGLLWLLARDALHHVWTMALGKPPEPNL